MIQHIWILYEFFVLCYEAYIKCCNNDGKSSVAGTYSTHLLSLQCCVIQKWLHYTDTKFYIDMVIKSTACYCIARRSYNFGTNFNCILLKICFHMNTIWVFVLCYEAYINCCDYGGNICVAGIYSTHLLSLQCCVIQKLLYYYTETKSYIDMVIKRTAFYCILILWRSYNFGTHLNCILLKICFHMNTILVFCFVLWSVHQML